VQNERVIENIEVTKEKLFQLTKWGPIIGCAKHEGKKIPILTRRDVGGATVLKTQRASDGQTQSKRRVQECKSVDHNTKQE
jgi:hypothetical protein